MTITKNKYLTDTTLNLLQGTDAYTPGYMSAVLTTATPTRTDTTANLARPTYAGYADVVLNNAHWSAITEAATGSSLVYTVDIVFTSPTSTPAFPVTITGFALMDDAGNIWYQGPLSTILTVNTQGQIIKIPANGLTITEA